MLEIDESRRELLLAGMLSLLPIGISQAAASPLNPAQTIITPANELKWVPNLKYPPHSEEIVNLFGDKDKPGLYLLLIKWRPGFMSAPHHYTSDRLCVVVSGTWYVNSGVDYDPKSCVPVSAGSFVRRVAGTPHYDGVPAGKPEPTIIAICGMGPVNYQLVDPSKPGWRHA